MRVKLEILNIETINYTDKKTGKPASFEVINGREAMPASVLLPFRLSARDFPSVKPGSVCELSVTELRKGDKDSSITLKGALVPVAAVTK